MSQDKIMRLAYTVAVGKIPLIKTRKTREALKLIKEQEGFLGLYPYPSRGTLLLFDTENNAKGARNVLRFHGVEVGDNIVKVIIDE